MCRYLKMKLKGYKSGREAPLTYIAKSHSKRTSTTSRAAQVRLKKQKEKARAKASSAIAAAATATLEKLQKGNNKECKLWLRDCHEAV